ncbi:MAG: S1C family serine protease [Rhodospirillales bacterium]
MTPPRPNRLFFCAASAPAPALALASALICAALAVFAAPAARAFDSDVLHSVVSVLPHWPDAPDASGASDTPRAQGARHPEGSGVVIFKGGHIVTAAHVLSEAARVDVRLYDGRLFPARIIGRDVMSDIALLRIDADLPARTVNHRPELGARVCAVGSPFGLGHSVSCGVVSALGRTGLGFNQVEDFIQTDAALNPGGSGGGLFDETGAFIGMSSAIFTPERNTADAGVNFAASAALVLRVAEDLRDFAVVRRPRAGLDVRAYENATPAGAPAGVPGVIVTRVEPGGAAARADLRVGDVMQAADGRRLRAPADLAAAVYLRRPGERMMLLVTPGGEGPVRTVFITLGPQR